MGDLYTSSVSIAGKSSVNRTGQRVGGDYLRLNTANIIPSMRISRITPQETSSTTGNSGTLVYEFTSTIVDAGSEPMKDTKQDTLDRIDREIAAMTDDQLVATILASAGAWADNPELTDDGFVNTRWFRTQEEWDAIIHGREDDHGDDADIEQK